MGEAVTYSFVEDEPKTTYEFVDEEPKQKPLGANAGLANLAATVLGMPVEAAKSVYNAGAMALGAPLVAAFGPSWEQKVYTNVPGDVESIRNALRGTGLPALNPDNPSPESKGETLAYDLTSRGAMVPGLALPAIGSVIAERTMGPEWAGVGALAPAAAVSGYNAMRAPSLARQEAQNAVRDQTLREGRKAGLVTPPSETGGGWFSRRLQSFGGKAATEQQASAKNQETINALVRKEIGLPENAPLTQETLTKLRKDLSGPYREVAKTSPVAAKALEKLFEAREQSNAAWREYNGPNHPRSALNDARNFDAQAQTLEKVIEREGAKAMKPTLLQDLRAARVAIAKVHDVERALNAATGDVSAKFFGKAFDRGKPLSGNLKTIGKFAEAFPKSSVEGAKVPAADISAANVGWGSLLGLGGYSALGHGGAALGAVPLLRGPTRSMILSDFYQNRMLPDYSPALQSPSAGPLLLQQLGLLNQ